MFVTGPWLTRAIYYSTRIWFCMTATLHTNEYNGPKQQTKPSIRKKKRKKNMEMQLGNKISLFCLLLIAGLRGTN